ncbi:MAG: hypothetical protein KGY70_17410 [Bacteroidales bacterium]|nr:hypothetical protein [Bacteroidales bacterium]
MTYQHSNIRIFYVFALILLLFIGCEDQQQPFPYVYVNVTFDIGTELDNLAIGEYVLLETEACSEAENCGYGGLIIYRSAQYSYQAFDRACPYKPEDKCLLERDDEFESLVACPCCGSRFIVTDDGRYFDGPAQRRLKEYNAYKESANQLKITN